MIYLGNQVKVVSEDSMYTNQIGEVTKLELIGDRIWVTLKFGSLRNDVFEVNQLMKLKTKGGGIR